MDKSTLQDANILHYNNPARTLYSLFSSLPHNCDISHWPCTSFHRSSLPSSRWRNGLRSTWHKRRISDRFCTLPIYHETRDKMQHVKSKFKKKQLKNFKHSTIFHNKFQRSPIGVSATYPTSTEFTRCHMVASDQSINSSRHKESLRGGIH